MAPLPRSRERSRRARASLSLAHDVEPLPAKSRKHGKMQSLLAVPKLIVLRVVARNFQELVQSGDITVSKGSWDLQGLVVTEGNSKFDIDILEVVLTVKKNMVYVQPESTPSRPLFVFYQLQEGHSTIQEVILRHLPVGVRQLMESPLYMYFDDLTACVLLSWLNAADGARIDAPVKVSQIELPEALPAGVSYVTKKDSPLMVPCLKLALHLQPDT